MWLHHAVTAVPGVPVVVVRWGPTVIWQGLHVSPALRAHFNFSFPYPLYLPPIYSLLAPLHSSSTTIYPCWPQLIFIVFLHCWQDVAKTLHKATWVEAHAVLINAGRLPSTRILTMRHVRNFKDSHTVTTICSVLLYLQMVAEWKVIKRVTAWT